MKLLILASALFTSITSVSAAGLLAGTAGAEAELDVGAGLVQRQGREARDGGDALVQGVVRSQPFRMSKPQPSTATTNEVAAR